MIMHPSIVPLIVGLLIVNCEFSKARTYQDYEVKELSIGLDNFNDVTAKFGGGRYYLPGTIAFGPQLENKMKKHPWQYPATIKGLSKAAKSLLNGKLAVLNEECFKLLPKVVSKCDKDSYNQLTDCYLIAKHSSYKSEIETVLSIVKQAIEEHGQLCRPGYMQRFEQLWGSREFTEDWKMLDEFINPETVRTMLNTDDIKASIRKSQIQWENFSSLRETLKVAREYNLVNRLLKACGTLNLMAADIFLPARVDLILDDEKIKEMNPSDKFTSTWLKFRICKILKHGLEISPSPVKIGGKLEKKQAQFNGRGYLKSTATD